MVSGITMTARYPRAAASAERPTPVLPLVGSMMVYPSWGRISPAASAASSMLFATRSFTEPAGLKYSSLASTRARRPSVRSMFASSSNGVRPMSSSTDP